MKKWIKADNGRVTQVIEFDDGSKMEMPLDNQGKLKWFDDTKLMKKSSDFLGRQQPPINPLCCPNIVTTIGIKVG